MKKTFISLFLLAAAVLPASQLKFEPAEALFAGDIPLNVPVLDFPQDKFGAEKFSIDAWVVPGTLRSAPDSMDTGYRGIAFKGDRGRMLVNFSLQLYDFAPNFSFVNPANGYWEGILRYYKSLRTGKYGTRLVPIKDCLRAVPNQWNHIAATFDRGRITTYVNGKIAAQTTSRATRIPWTNHKMIIGCGQGDGGGTMAFFNGYIAKVECYNQTLSPQEVKAIYDREKAKYPAGKISVPSAAEKDFGNFSPDFKNKLEITKKFEKNLPPQLKESNTPVTVEMRNGAPCFVKDNKIIPSMVASMTAKSQDADSFACARDFAAAGVPNTGTLIQTMRIWNRGIYNWWTAPGKYDFSVVDRGIQAMLDANPQGRIMLRIKVDAPRWWANKHKDEAGCTIDNKTDRFQPSFNSPSWKKDGTAALAALLKHIESQPYAGRIYCYIIAGGRASEWYWWGTHHGCVDYSKCNIAAWRNWLKKRYKSLPALRRAWKDDKVTFETAMIPTPDAREKVSEYGFFRYWPRARTVVDYRFFLSDSVTDAMALFVKTAKTAVGGKKPLGVFYGYTLWHPELSRQGFHNLDKVLANPDIDFLIGPVSYDRRRAGMEGDYLNGYTSSLTLHKKLYYDEADMRTCFANDFQVYKTPTVKETLDIHWRTLGNALTQGVHIQWLTLAGAESFHDERLMAQFAKMAEIEKKYQEAPRKSRAEAALIVDEKSMVFVNDSVRRNHDYVRLAKSEIGHAGFAYDTYLYSDMFNKDMPDYKLYIFTNLWNAEKNLDKLHAKLARNKAAAVWFYAPGFITYGGVSTKTMKRLTGFDFTVSRRSGSHPLKVTGKAPWTKYLARDYELYNFDPVFSVSSPGAETVAVLDKHNAISSIDAPWGGKSYYSLTRPTAGLLRGIAEASGVHIYNKSGDLVRANESFLMIHASGNGRKELYLPEEQILTDLATGKSVKAKKVTLELKNGETVIYHTKGTK